MGCQQNFTRIFFHLFGRDFIDMINFCYFFFFWGGGGGGGGGINTITEAVSYYLDMQR